MGREMQPEDLVRANMLILQNAQYAAARHLANKCREKVSVQAPLVRAKKSGRIRAAMPATPGAPPRRVSGIFKISIEEVWDETEQSWAVGSSVPYAQPLEDQGHLWLTDTMQEEMGAINAILEREAR